jgi:dTDP-glucose pyrophosphorylase
MKALVLAGGRGARLGEMSDARNKCMIEVAGRPLIEYSLQCALRAGLSEIVIVVGYRAEELINAYGNGFKGLPIRYVIQQEQKGVVNAIECCREAVGGSDFMLMLGDELLVNPDHRGMVAGFDDDNIFSLCGVVEVKDRSLISRTYSVIQGDDRRIYRLVEKPGNPLNNLMGTGNILFRNEILSYIEGAPINQKRGEKELPDLIQCAVDDGKVVKSYNLCERYINVNSSVELEEAASYFAHL